MPLFKEIQLVQFDPLSERVGRRHLSVQISLFLSFLEWIGYVFSAIGIVIQWYRSIYEWAFRDVTPTYDIPFSALSFISVFKGTLWLTWVLTDQILVLVNIETKESLYYEYWYLFFDLHWMIFKRISVLNLGGIYCENKNKSHTKFKMFLCMKNPNENILHFILSLKFLFKNVCCCISLFLSMQLQFQYYIIRGIY